MVAKVTLNNKINDLKKTLIKKEKAILKKVAVVAKDKKELIVKQSKDIRKMYEQHVNENLLKYIAKPYFWIDVMTKATIMGFITYLSYKAMNHSQFTRVKALVWKEAREKEANRGIDVKTWSEQIENNPRFKSVSLSNDGDEDWSRDNKTYLISKSPPWQIILDVFLQVFMRIIFAVVIRVGIRGFFNQFDFFDNDVSTKAWDAVVIVSSIIVTYSSEELTDKINLLFGYISIRN